MNEILEFCQSEIRRCDSVINPILEKTGMSNTFEFMRKADVSEELYRTVLKFSSQKDSYVKLSNWLTSLFETNIGTLHEDGIEPHDLDQDAKRRMLYNVTGHLFKFITTKGIPYTRMDGVPTDHVVNTSIGCIMQGELEMAVYGLVYALYQKNFQHTNRVDKLLESAAPAVDKPEGDPPSAA